MSPHPRVVVPLLMLVVVVNGAVAAEPEKTTGANWALARKFTKEFVDQHVHPAFITPSFIGKTDQFWYGLRTPEGVRYWKVDPAAKTKTPLFDHARLLAQLSEAAQKPLDAASFQIRGVSVSEDGAKLKFSFDVSQYEYDLTANAIKKLGKAPAEQQRLPQEVLDRMTDDERRQYFERFRDQQDQKKDDIEEKKDEKKDIIEEKKDEKKDDGQGRKGIFGFRFGDYKAYSPDKKKYLYAFRYNLYLAEEGKEAEAKQLSTDGVEDYGYGVGSQTRRSDGTLEKPQPPSDRKTRPQVTWSKDSKRFTVTRTDRRGMKELFLVDSIATPRPALERYRYSMPGEEAIAKGELYVGDADAKTLTRLKPKWKDEAYADIHFGKTSDDIEFIRRDRLRRHHEFCRVNAKTGEEKCLIAEGFEAAYLEVSAPKIIEETDELIWWSERSGWGHLYLYDRDGKLKNPITSGEWRVGRVVDVDAKNRLVYFMGNAREPGENVYYTHLYRVRTDGSDLTNLTPTGAGDLKFDPHLNKQAPAGSMHRVWLSPSKKYVVDNFSRVDLAPAAVVRDDKGNVLMDLEDTDLRLLEKTGWKPPESFSVKAADGVTDLFGNLWKPFDFTPAKKYPIIVYVYPGPQQEGVTHTFSAWSTYQQLAQLGFIVIQVGHRGGCPERSKAYHSFGYFNLRDYGLVDKKAAIEALAGRHSWIDIERVGIYGHSGGGFMSGAAMLQKPYNEFFKAAVASAGNHDNNIYNNYWSETYHGLREVTIEEKKTDGAKTDAKDTTRTGTGGVRKGPADSPDELPPPRVIAVDKPSKEAMEELQKKIDELKKQITAELGKGESRKDEIAGLFKKLEALLAQQDDFKKALAPPVKKEETKKEEIKKEEAKKDVTVEAPKTKFDIKIPTNAELAANLKGHLLLVHGEIDNNVHPANTMRLADALIKANKRFELLIIPGARHAFGPAQPYFTDRLWDFFAEHLLDDRQTKADIKERESRKAGR